MAGVAFNIFRILTALLPLFHPVPELQSLKDSFSVCRSCQIQWYPPDLCIRVITSLYKHSVLQAPPIPPKIPKGMDLTKAQGHETQEYHCPEIQSEKAFSCSTKGGTKCRANAETPCRSVIPCKFVMKFSVWIFYCLRSLPCQESWIPSILRTPC